MELGGPWRAALADDTLRRSFPDPELSDDGWTSVEVPGHWRSTAEFSTSDGPLLYRRRFETPDGEGSRSWLDLDGLFYEGDVWLDGSYLGDTEGYFARHSFEITEALALRREHLLAVEVTCSTPTEPTAKRNLTGIFQHWDCIDPSWNPGGIWAPVRIARTGPVRITTLRVLCPDARAERAILYLEANLDAADATAVTITTEVRRCGGGAAQSGVPGNPGSLPVVEKVVAETLSAGRNTVKWRVTVERPELWWPRALGDQPLYEVVVRVDLGGAPSDQTQVITGLRQVRMRNFVATVNGERLFLKGANAGPVSRGLADVGAAECERDVRLAAEAGLDLLRIHAHIARPELYDAADRAGMLIWQDLPLQWGYANVRRQAVRQARQAVQLLGHHPSVAIWCAHNEPFAMTPPAGGAIDGATARRFAAAQFLPGFNKTVLDGSVKRALERADRSRPVIAHSGVLPHPSGGTDSHLYCGWYHNSERDLPSILARLPVLARFVGEFGAQAVPDSSDFMEPVRWPDLDWALLADRHCLQKEVFDRRVPPADHDTFDSWRIATQAYQANLLRHHVETLRRLKYRPTGGFCQFLLADSQPAVSWSVLDHERRPKTGYRALTDSCAPVIIVAERLAATYRPGMRVRVAVHAISDLRTALGDATVDAVIRWPGGTRRWRFAGEVGADACVRIGRLELTLPTSVLAGELSVELEMSWRSGDDEAPVQVHNRYSASIVG